MSPRLNFMISVFTTPPSRAIKRKSLRPAQRLAVFAIAFAIGVLPALSQSTPIAEDSFNYPPGPLGGNGSSTDPGWLGAWDGAVTVLSGGSLAYIDSGGKRLVTAGNKVRAPGFSYRFLDTPLENSTYSEVWISFMIDSFNVGIRWAGISLYNSGQELLFMGKLGLSPNLGVHEWPNNQRFPTSETLSGPVFFVVRLRFYESSTEWTYWLNPDLDETPPDSDAVASDTHDIMASVNRIRIAGEEPVEFDELRIGTDYSSVAPYLKPSLPAEDSFNYPPGYLTGQGSSADHGWFGSWNGLVRVLDADSLAYTDTGGNQLVTGGRRLEAPGLSYRYLESPLANLLYSEVWISFLIDDFDWGTRWAGVSLYNDFQELFFMGKLGARYYLGVHEWPNNQRFPTSATLSGPVFFVVRLRFHESSTEWTYWLNPDLDETPPDSDAVASDTHDVMYLVNRIRVGGDAPIDLDELRIGTSYSSVAPFIEPNQAPLADAGPDQTVYVGETCQAQVILDGSGSSDPDEDILTYTWEDSFGQVHGVNPTVTLGLGTHDITLTVSDGDLSDTDTVRIYVEDNSPPLPEVDPLPVIRGECSAQVPPSPTAIDNCSGQIIGTTTDPLNYMEQGTYFVTWTYDDGNGNTTTQTQTVIVEDTTPPSIDTISASPDVIWPPNHKMVPVTISVVASDNCDADPTCQIISIASNEPENGLGDGDTAPDWEITGDLTANLRAERAGNGSGRVYTITVRCTDSVGNSTDQQVTVTVPHDKKKK